MDARDHITIDVGYQAMLQFLESYFDRTKAEEIAILLGSLSLAADGRPMDPALWDDWLNAVQRAVSHAGTVLEQGPPT